MDAYKREYKLRFSIRFHWRLFAVLLLAVKARSLATPATAFRGLNLAAAQAAQTGHQQCADSEHDACVVFHNEIR